MTEDADVAVLAKAAKGLLGGSRATTAEPATAAMPLPLAERDSVDLLLDESIPFDAVMGILADRQQSKFPKPKPKSLEPPEPICKHTLEQVVAMAGAKILGTTKLKERFRVLWAAAKYARRLGSDEVHAALMQLAIESGLNERDADHVIRWGVRDMNPFEN